VRRQRLACDAMPDRRVVSAVGEEGLRALFAQRGGEVLTRVHHVVTSRQRREQAPQRLRILAA
jgi:hypothetical protein